MQTFTEYSTESRQIQTSLLEFLAITAATEQLVENADLLAESKFDQMLAKAGLMAHQTDKGLISQFKKIGKGVGELFIAAIRRDKTKIKEIAKRVDRNDVAQFIFNLDQVSVFILTTPLHIINALTGWEITANDIVKTAKITANKIKTELKKIKDLILSFFEKDQAKKFAGILDDIESSIPT